MEHFFFNLKVQKEWSEAINWRKTGQTTAQRKWNKQWSAKHDTEN